MVWQDFKQNVLHFVVLKHVRDADTHWDLMLQMPDKELLATWRIRVAPSLWIGHFGPIPAWQLPDHRMEYLHYEGEISGGRGRVSQVDGGVLELIAYNDQEINFILRGRMLHGRFALTAESPGAHHPSDQWQLTARAT